MADYRSLREIRYVERNALGYLYLRVSIDYDLPSRGFGRWLGKLFGKTYARWCATRMANDAAEHFGSPIG